jgi:murein DD-endopeptidase MepM/ murein hydrolase activator NlpD
MGRILDAIVGVGRATGRVLGSAAGATAGAINRNKPFTDVVTDPLLAYGIVNVGGLAATYHWLLPELQDLSDGSKLAATLGAGAVMGAVDLLLLPRVVRESVRDSIALGRNPTRSRLGSWMKTLGGAALAYIAVDKALEVFETHTPARRPGISIPQEPGVNLENRLSTYEMGHGLSFPMDADETRVTSEFKPPHRPTHNGVDLSSALQGQCEGMPVYAAREGVVKTAGRKRNGYGNFNNGYWIDIDHGDGLRTRYLHLQGGSLLVSEGEKVSAGMEIAACGNTGNSRGPHLHFQVDKNGTPVDPFDKEGSTPEQAGNYHHINYSNAELQRKIATGTYEEGFLDEIEAMSTRLDMNAMGLLSVMDFETGGTFSPSVRNPTGSATGLIQFTGRTARALGTSTADLAGMSQVEQLAFVEQYFEENKNGGDYSNPNDIAMAVFFPAAIGHGEDHVLGRRSGGSRFQRRVFRQNHPLDVNGDGIITAGEYVVPALNRGYF